MAGQSKDDIAKALKALSTGANPPNDDVPARPLRPAQPAPAHQPLRRLAPTTTPEPQQQQRITPAAKQAPKPATPARAAAPVLHAKHLELKRTLIPILLTLGGLLPLLGALSLALGDESPLADQFLIPVLMLVLGALILASAIFTMLQVRHAMRSARPAH